MSFQPRFQSLNSIIATMWPASIGQGVSMKFARSIVKIAKLNPQFAHMSEFHLVQL
jgi:hypothetical protein